VLPGANVPRADICSSQDALILRDIAHLHINAERLIFRGKTKQAIIADQCSLKPVTGIACEFDARRRSPPHNYSIVAPTARRI